MMGGDVDDLLKQKIKKMEEDGEKIRQKMINTKEFK
jgi:hypothetical protein